MSRQRVLRSKLRRLVQAVIQQEQIIEHLLQTLTAWPERLPSGRWRLLRYEATGDAGIRKGAFLDGHFSESSRGPLFETDGGEFAVYREEFAAGSDIFTRCDTPSTHLLRETVEPKAIRARLDTDVVSIVKKWL